MISAKLLNEYRKWRIARISPSNAITRARANIAAGKASPVGYTSFFQCAGIGAAFKVGSSVCRWVESPMHSGLRFVGRSDDIAPTAVRHKGWYLEDEGLETAFGVVLQLPARSGNPLFVAAVATSYDDEGAAVCFDTTDDKTTAAIWADQLAERYAENERDYQRASGARLQFDELADDIARHRKSCLALIRDVKQHGQKFGAAICELIRENIASHIADIRKAREDRARLESDFARCDGWNN